MDYVGGYAVSTLDGAGTVKKIAPLSNSGAISDNSLVPIRSLSCRTLFAE